MAATVERMARDDEYKDELDDRLTGGGCAEAWTAAAEYRSQTAKDERMDTDTAQIRDGYSRRRVIRDTGAIAGVLGPVGSLTSHSGGLTGVSNTGGTERDFDGTAIEGTLQGKLLEAASPQTDTLSSEEQAVLGESVTDHAGTLLERLSSKGILENATVDVDQLRNGHAFDTLAPERTARETGGIAFWPELDNQPSHTDIYYRHHQPADSGYIDAETRVTTTITPKADRAVTVVEPADLPVTERKPVRHLRRVIEPGRDLASEIDDDQIVQAISNDDVIAYGYSWTYCLLWYVYSPRGENAGCTRMRIHCINRECTEYPVGGCSGCSNITKKCQNLYVGGEPIEKDPCHSI